MSLAPSINSRMAKGIVWMVAARFVDRFIGIISTLILARLLIPDDFGLVAMATAIGGILDLLGAFSFDLALIQNANAERRHYDTVWTFNLLFGITCGLGLIALAGTAAAFYHEARLEQVMYFLSLSYFIAAFNNIGIIAFRKDLNFHQEFAFVFIRRLVTFIVTISGAFLLKSYWALLFGIVIGRFCTLVMSYTMHDYRPRLTLSAARELFNFSKWLLINNALFFMLHNGCTFIIGRLYGTAELGIYAVAYEIASLPSTELVAPINRATFPGFSKMQERSEIAAAYLKLFGMIFLTILPVGLGIAAVAHPLVLTMLGDKWIAAVPLIQLLAIHGAVSATQGNNGPVWLAMGKPRDLTLLATYFLAVLFPGLYYFLGRYGVVGAGYAYILANIATVPCGMWISYKLLGFRWSALLATVWRPLIGIACMFGAVLALEAHTAHLLPLVRLLIHSAAGALAYMAVILSLWQLARRPDGAEAYLLARLPWRAKPG